MGESVKTFEITVESPTIGQINKAKDQWYLTDCNAKTYLAREVSDSSQFEKFLKLVLAYSNDRGLVQEAEFLMKNLK